MPKPHDSRLVRARRLFDAGELAAAERECRELLLADPQESHALHVLAAVNLRAGRVQIALALVRRALMLNHAVPAFHHTLGLVLLSRGDVESAIEAFRQALRIDPDYAVARSSLLWSLHFTSSSDREALLMEAQDWARRHAPPQDGPRAHGNRPHPDRRLRVGYVSADLYHHPVGYFLESVLRWHDPSDIEVYCYANSLRVDDQTDRLRAAARHWRIVASLSKSAVAAMIRQDQIDILVDLSGHTGGNRLAVFARKPAPVQATWMGYEDTTGLTAMDYLIGDPYVCPPDDDRYYVERLVRLPDAYLCYASHSTLPVAPLPAATRGYVTFGCLSSLARVTPAVIDLWARVLSDVPGSRLFLKDSAFDERDVRDRIRGELAVRGVTPERVLTAGRSPYDDHLAAYSGVDIVLDTFPYNGCTGTTDALWMGVPVVSLVGERFLSRIGLSFLSAVGLSELAAPSPDEYLAVAIGLASDLDRLAALRAGLRTRLATSPLCDGRRFTRNLEAAYRQMWRTWCRSADGHLAAASGPSSGTRAVGRPIDAVTMPRVRVVDA